MIKILFCGDVMLGRLVNDYLISSHDYRSIWGDTLDIFRSANLTLINLECALTNETFKGKKDAPVFFFRSNPENVSALTVAGVDFCSLANNHTLDFGIKGLAETIQTLKSERIFFAGAGEDISNAQKPAEFNLKNQKIKVYSFTDNEPSWKAGLDKPGTNYLPIDIRDEHVYKLMKQIKRDKTLGYFVIVSAHWGPNMVRVPPQEHIEFAHAVIDAGCKVFYGHSSHVFQPVEIYKRGVIFYDCGEMIDDYAVDPILRNDESFLFEVLVERKKISKVILYPIKIYIKSSFSGKFPFRMQTNFLKGIEANNLCLKMVNLCSIFSTAAEIKEGKIEIKV